MKTMPLANNKVALIRPGTLIKCWLRKRALSPGWYVPEANEQAYRDRLVVALVIDVQRDRSNHILLTDKGTIAVVGNVLISLHDEPDIELLVIT